MKKVVSKKKIIVVVITLVAIIGTLVGRVSTGVFASKNIEETGAQNITLHEYERDNGSSYIGWGYNIIDKNYINASDVQKIPIFNIIDKESDEYKKNIGSTDIIYDSTTNNIRTYEIESEKTSDFVKKYLNEMAGGVGILSDWCGFTQISPRASLKYDVEDNEKKENKYLLQVRQMETAYVNWLLDEDEYYDYLTERFKKEVLTMEPKALFKKYGTHVITGVKMGGKIELKHHMSSDDKKDLENATAKLTLEVEGIFEGLLEKDDENIDNSSDTNKDTSKDTSKPTEPPKDKKDGEKEFDYHLDYKDNKTYKNVLKTTYTTCYGGKGCDMSDETKIAENYSKWIDSVEKKPAIIGILGEDSLYPIWKLVKCIADNDDSLSAEDAAARMKELEDAFNEYGLENYNKLIADEIELSENKKKVEELDIAPLGVKARNFYDKTKLISEKKQKLHEGWDLGKVLVVNAQKDMDGFYKYNENDDIQIRFRLDQNMDKLPTGKSKYSSHNIVYNDTPSGKVDEYGNVFGNHYIKGLGKGCYFMQVTYNNQKVDTVKDIDFLNKMKKNETITMLDTSELPVEENGGIDKIAIFVTYRTDAWGVLAASTQDWVLEKELDFK